jgi:hypothetical protein
MEFAETDFVPLDDFSLRWRFADAMYGYVSPDFARRVRPLSPERAAALSIEAHAFIVLLMHWQLSATVR